MKMIKLCGCLLSFMALLLVGFPDATSFHIKALTTTQSPHRHKGRIVSRVYMGRSLEEQKLSKKELFRRLRSDVNKAAAEPGFYPKNEPDIELYCKSDRSGLQNGDCPYAQFIQMVLLKKGVNYVVKPVSPAKIPSWIINNHNSELPVILHEGSAMTGPLAIAEYIDQKYPQNSLTRQGICSYQEALEKTKNFFPAVKSFILNKDVLLDASFRNEVVKELNNIESLLISTPGRFLCGVEMTLADLYLLPQLFHAMVALEHFKKFEAVVVDGDSCRPVLDSYVDKMLDLKEFNHKKAYCGVDKVVFGWKVARGEATFNLPEKDG